MHRGRLKVKLAKSRLMDGDKSAVALLKNVRQLGCVFQDTEPPESLPISRKSTHKSWDQFDKYGSQQLRSAVQTSEKTKVRRSEKSVKAPHSGVPTQ